MSTPHNPLESPNGSPELVIDLNDGSLEQVSIVVVHHNKPEYLNICLQSIHCCSHLSNYEVIVVDNASSDQDTSDYLDVLEEEGIKVIRNKENQYWSAACNQGVKAADPNSSYYVFMHADTVVLNPAWLDILINISVSKGAGIVGTELSEYIIQKQKVQFVQEWCMLVSKECWEAIGEWPEELPIVGMSFIMTLKGQVLGYKPTATGNQIVHHYRSLSFDPSQFEKMAEEAMATVPKLMQAIQAQG